MAEFILLTVNKHVTQNDEGNVFLSGGNKPSSTDFYLIVLLDEKSRVMFTFNKLAGWHFSVDSGWKKPSS